MFVLLFIPFINFFFLKCFVNANPSVIHHIEIAHIIYLWAQVYATQSNVFMPLLGLTNLTIKTSYTRGMKSQ